ncbi:MAG TPA: hypothetical protein DHV62_06035 [Elusimicrobia bacterium]|jgi:mannose/fructose-specific phosphotransferase system component IIA|nr:hypothetical protein [Elusimicrobiota bacterium]
MTTVIILTRGNFGEKMLESAIEILGPQEKTYSFSFFSDQDPEILKQQIIEKIYELNCPEGVLILTDMCGGTPCNLALSVVKEIEKKNIKCGLVSGFNLYLLISVLSKRVNLSLEELIEQVINDGRKNILNAKDFFLKKGVPSNE